MGGRGGWVGGGDEKEGGMGWKGRGWEGGGGDGGVEGRGGKGLREGRNPISPKQSEESIIRRKENKDASD